MGGAQSVEPLASAVSGHRLGLADVGGRAEGLVIVHARVERVQRDARGNHGLSSRLDAGRVGQRDGDAVGAGGDGRLNLLGLPQGVVVGAEVDHLAADGCGGVAYGHLDH